MATSEVQARSGFVDNWQAGKTLAECNMRMLKREDSCDVKAHRYVLIKRSCVFHARFYGPLAETSDVSIPEIEAAFFKQVLIYLYTNDVTLDSDNTTALLYAARKYAVSGLENKCKSFMENNLTVENACVILEASHRFDQKEIYEKALTLIKREGDRSLQSPDFLALSQVLVDQIIESNDLNAEEHAVFTAVNNWAETECGRQRREITPEAKRSVLGETLLKVRFPLMKLNCLTTNVKKNAVYTAEGEVFDVIFIHPVSVTAGEWYTLAVKMVGPITRQGTGGMSRVVCEDGVKFDFRNSSKSTNGTKIDRGQITSLIYSVIL